MLFMEMSVGDIRYTNEVAGVSTRLELREEVGSKI